MTHRYYLKANAKYMDNPNSFVDPNADFDENNPLRDDAVNYQAINKHGKKCLLVDNTGKGLNEADCREILDSLIENDIFGFRTLSASGGDTISLERRESTHVQVGEDLYRLIVFRYEARIELF